MIFPSLLIPEKLLAGFQNNLEKLPDNILSLEKELPFQFLKSVEIFTYFKKFNINLNYRLLNSSNDTLFH